jgi:hypothetical protein
MTLLEYILSCKQKGENPRGEYCRYFKLKYRSVIVKESVQRNRDAMKNLVANVWLGVITREKVMHQAVCVQCGKAHLTDTSKKRILDQIKIVNKA